MSDLRLSGVTKLRTSVRLRAGCFASPDAVVGGHVAMACVRAGMTAGELRRMAMHALSQADQIESKCGLMVANRTQVGGA